MAAEYVTIRPVAMRRQIDKKHHIDLTTDGVS